MPVSVTPGNVLLTTTDTRMQKPVHLASNPILEIAWWIDDSAVQFRITGEGYTVPSPDAPNGHDLIDKAVKALGQDGAGGREGNPEWWEGKRREMWAKEMSGHLRGSFGRPQPGKKMSEIVEKPEDWLQRLDVESVGLSVCLWGREELIRGVAGRSEDEEGYRVCVEQLRATRDPTNGSRVFGIEADT